MGNRQRQPISISWVALVAMGAGGCASTGGESSPPLAQQDEGTSKVEAVVPEAAPVTAAEAQFFARAFPGENVLLPQPIPVEMIRSIDQGNDRYIRVENKAGEVLGYLRPIDAPVTIGAECECNPLQTTLVFGPDYEFLKLISAAPLQKLGHAPMTDQDTQRLIEILKDPPRELVTVRRIEGVVDATTGATKAELAEHVVPQAGLSTRRLLGLVRDTQRILHGAPSTWDNRRLQAALRSTDGNDGAQARAMANLLDKLESQEAVVHAYRIMTSAYRQAAVNAKSNGTVVSKDPEVEAALLKPRGPIDATEIVSACYGMTNAEVHLDLTKTCATLHGSATPKGQILTGTLHYIGGDYPAAVSELQASVSQVSVYDDHNLHLRYAAALAKTDDSAGACAAGKAVFTAHPLLDAAADLLTNCGDKEATRIALSSEMKKAFIGGELTAGATSPELPVEDFTGKGSDIFLQKKGVVTVAVFFATWCPHCRVEFPRLTKFVEEIKESKKASKIQMVGIRTAVEKETESYEEFAKTFSPNFTVWTDAVMALAFSKFARSQGFSPTLPTVVVIDEAGFVRFKLPTGDFRDTAQELHWATQHVLKNPPKRAAANLRGH